MIQSTDALLDELISVYSELDELYKKVLDEDRTVLGALKEEELDLDDIDVLFVNKEQYADTIEVLFSQSEDIIARFDADEARRLFPDKMSILGKLAEAVNDKTSSIEEIEKQIKTIIESKLEDQKKSIIDDRKKASKARKYLAAINGVSIASDSVIDTSKKI